MTPLRLAVVSILIGILPFLSAILASLMAAACGCEISEAGVTGKCMLFGADISSTLYSMTVLAWFGMITMPLAVVGLVAAGIWAIGKAW